MVNTCLASGAGVVSRNHVLGEVNPNALRHIWTESLADLMLVLSTVACNSQESFQ